MTAPKPEHLSEAYAAQFADRAVVDAYDARPPYPADLGPALAGTVRTTLVWGTPSG